MNTLATILELGSQRHCFLSQIQVKSFQKNSRPPSYNQRDDGIQIYEAEIRARGKVYFSTHGSTGTLSSGDTVQLTALYAEKLGLKENDPLLLKRVNAALPSAKKVFVEPVSVDDWEMVEQNSRHIENILLDQIRVIWPGQTFPLWLYRSVCIFMKIVSVEPMSFCVILESSTDLVVAPKVRSFNPPKSLGLRGPVANPKPLQPREKTPVHQSGGVQVWGRDDQDVSMQDTPLDTLEPRPNIKSPSRSPRLVNRRRQMKNQPYLSHSDRTSDRIPKPVLRRQSTVMESFMRYVFGFIEKKEYYDNLSESDASSGFDFAQDNDLPARSGVLRVQPMKLKCTLEDCFPVKKQAIHSQMMSRIPFGQRRNPPMLNDIGGKSNEQCGVPYELFQPSTVYVDVESTKIERELHPYLPRLPYNLIAKLQRLPSPQEKVEAHAKASKKGKDVQDKTSTTFPSSSLSTSQQKDGRGSRKSSKKENLPDIHVPVENVDADVENINASCYVRVVVIDRKAGLTDEAWQDAADRLLSDQPLMSGHVIIPDLLRRQLKLDATGSVWLQTGSIEFVIPKKISLYPVSPVPRRFSNELLIDAFKNHLNLCANNEHPLVIFQGLLLRFLVVKDNAMEVQIKFYGENGVANPSAVSMLSQLNIDVVLIQVERDIQDDKTGVINPLLAYSKVSDFDPTPPTVKLKHLGGMENVAYKGLAHLQACLGSRPISRTEFMARSGLCHGILLITGPKGSGKSSLSKALCRKMAQLPTMAHISLLDCKALRGKSVSNIQKTLESIFDEAAWRQPALIVLDNLDAIMPMPSGPESEMNGESIYSAKNSEAFQGLLKYEMENNSRLAVIATCSSKSNLHPSLVSFRGSHLIQESLNIGSPDQEVRSKILGCILQQHSSVSIETLKTINLRPIAIKTEGFVARDLESLVNRSIHSRLVKDPEGSGPKVTLHQDDFEEVLESFKPVSIRGVSLHKAGELGWEDVGGLDDVKKSLIETLKWPAKYPRLFSSCPLRLRSGVLLYGAPGTGKTLLAGIVAKECELNFISIKGPELLSKYIGASEQAVRDLFTRAQSAKPCILFFDEFDSIAPKRGHDSTGVTDRVVNQLLTQLDGVEGLQGVYVLAATSRPDLIDPALLRPGRLDKSLLCTIPSSAERWAILEALTRNMLLSNDVELEEIADMCEHFTGADLKALLYNAQLKAIHEKKSSRQPTDDPTMVRIKADDDECPAVVLASDMFDDAFRTQLEESRVRSNSTKTSPDILLSTNLMEGEVQRREPSEESSVSDQSQITSTVNRPDLESVGGFWKTHVNSNDGDESCDIVSATDVFPVMPNMTAKSGNGGFEALQDANSEETNVRPPGKDRHSSQLGLRQAGDLQTKSHPFLNGKNLPSVNDNPSVPPPSDTQFDEGADIEVDGYLDSVAEEDFKTSPSRSPAFISLTSTPKYLNLAGDPVSIPLLNVEGIEDDTIMNSSLQIKGSASMNHFPGDPSLTYPPPTTRRKRSFERTQSCTEEGQKRNVSGEMSRLKVDKMVTVFSSLELGLATLSPEDEAKYMAMARQIIQRDDRLFAVANDRRRTSFMLTSQTTGLLKVCHHHLVEAVATMRPSVTAQERAKYLHIYEKFVSSRTAGFEKNKGSPEKKEMRATLA